MMTQVRKRSPGQRSSPPTAPPARPPATPALAACCQGPLDTLLDPELFKALADPTRLALIACIAKCARPCSVSEVAQCCAVDMSVVSRHLAQLARAGILEAAKDGRVMRYSVRYVELCVTLRSLAAALEECCPDSDNMKGAGNERCC